MAGHQGLHRVTKTVRGKKGSVHRAYWVKNEAGPAAHPGIMHRAAVGAAKVGAVALAGAAVLAGAAYGAHRLSSHMASHGGGSVGRQAGLRSAISPQIQGQLHSARAALGGVIHGAQTRMSEAINHRNAVHISQSAPTHSGIVRKSLKTNPEPHPHFGAGSAEPRRHFGAGSAEPRRHFGAGSAETGRSRGHAKITGAASHELAASFALDRVIGRSKRR